MSGASWVLNEYRHLSTTTHTELTVNEVLSFPHMLLQLPFLILPVSWNVVWSLLQFILLCSAKNISPPPKKSLTIHQIIFPSLVSLLNVISIPLKALWKIIDKNVELHGTKAEACGIPLDTFLEVDISCIKSAFLGSSLGWLQNHLIVLSLSLLFPIFFILSMPCWKAGTLKVIEFLWWIHSSDPE